MSLGIDIASRREARGDPGLHAEKEGRGHHQHRGGSSRELNRRLLESQEWERRRLSRELHDELGQQVSCLQLQLAAARRAATAAERETLFEELHSALEQLRLQIHDLALDLRPPMLDDLGLVSSLRWYLNHHLKNAPLSKELMIIGDIPRLSSSVQTVAFRVAQEALTNVVRHAGASSVTVTLEASGSALRLEVADDGEGFRISEIDAREEESFQSLGLLGMKERLALVRGNMWLSSETGTGTRLVAEIPLDGHREGRLGS
ncbi:MAG: sensor histidine kinase [Thermoanaerobaculia bacterium]|nr:sensor histidine kinase [Thermoanaerobaculia bacterium]